MRIGLNLLYLIPNIVGGTEIYAAGLLQGLTRVAKQDEFVVFVNRESASWPLPSELNFTRVVCPLTASNRAKRYYFEQIRLPLLLREHEVDLVHSLGYVGPVISSCPAVVSIPDLNYVDQARTMSAQRRFALSFISRIAASKAHHVITISGYSRERICRILKLPHDKITVTHLAPQLERNTKGAENWTNLKQIYGIRKPYVVAFGGGAIHKNIDALLQAFSMVHHQLPHNLVLIGHLPQGLNLMTSALDTDMFHRLITTGYVPNSHIYPLLSHAELFVMPSLYEGFGLPVLEAQQADTAVACSTAGSLPEVAGDGALYFDPNSIEAIADAIVCCLSNSTLRMDLRQRGRDNLKRFSWEKTATNTLKVYYKAMAHLETK